MKSYTDLEQSKKLAKILPIESADMYWQNGVSDKYFQCFTPFVRDATNMNYDYDVPCWSLAALLELMHNNSYILRNTSVGNNRYNIWAVQRKSPVWYKTPLDAVVEMIVWLKENDKL